MMWKGKGFSNYKSNPAGLKAMAQNPQMSAAMQQIGDMMIPRINSYGGRFTRGYRVRSEQIDGTRGARVFTHYPFAHWDEWGNIYRAPRAPVRKTLASMGLLSRTKMTAKK